MSTTTSLLHTALQNLHVAQQVHNPSYTPGPPSSSSSRPANDSSDDDEYVAVGKGTAPGTPVGARGMMLGQRIRKDNAARDPVGCQWQTLTPAPPPPDACELPHLPAAGCQVVGTLRQGVQAMAKVQHVELRCVMCLLR